MKKAVIIILFVLVATWFVFATPEPRVGSGSGSGSDAAAITNLEASFGLKSGRIGYAPATGTNTNTVSVGWEQSNAGRTNIGATATHQAAPLVISGSFVTVPITNHANALTVITNTMNVRRPSATNYTLTFSGTMLDGTILLYDAINTAATNYTITVPSTLNEDTPGNPAFTTVLCRSNSITQIRWKYNSGNWTATIRQPSGVVVDETESLYVPGQANATTMVVTNNATFVTANLSPSSDSTNFTADFTYGARTYTMTNAFWLSAVANVPAANLWKGWSAVLVNNSGGALSVGLATTIKRSGTNNVSVPNGSRAKVVLEPDGTGGSSLTNFLGQIILFQNP